MASLLAMRVGLPLSLLNWAYVRQEVYLLGVWYAWGIDFRRFRMPSLSIFGVILRLLEATKMYVHVVLVTTGIE